MGYREALQWLLDNDDCSWLDEEVGGAYLPSVPASLCADIYRKTTAEVERDLRRRRDTTTPNAIIRKQIEALGVITEERPVMHASITTLQIQYLMATLRRIPRRNAHHRAILVDCEAVLKGSLCAKELVVDAFNELLGAQP